MPLAKPVPVIVIEPPPALSAPAMLTPAAWTAVPTAAPVSGLAPPPITRLPPRVVIDPRDVTFTYPPPPSVLASSVTASAPEVELMPASTMMLPTAFRVRLVAAPADFRMALLTVMSPLPWPSPRLPLVCSTTLVPALSAVLMSVFETLLPPAPEV